MDQIYLSRRNLLTLLSKLNREKMGDLTVGCIIKYDNTHKKYPQSMESIMVFAIEDAEYYDREPGEVYLKDVENL